MLDIKTLISGKRFVLLLLFAPLLCFPISNAAQTKEGKFIVWEWTNPLDKDLQRLNFKLAMEIKGAKARGSFTFQNMIGGEWDGNDGNIMPFIGTVSGNTVKIEFDPQDLRNAIEYEFDTIKYKRPKGKLPSTATLVIRKRNLEWTQTRGLIPVILPRNSRKFVMKRKN